MARLTERRFEELGRAWASLKPPLALEAKDWEAWEWVVHSGRFGQVNPWERAKPGRASPLTIERRSLPCRRATFGNPRSLSCHAPTTTMTMTTRTTRRTTRCCWRDGRRLPTLTAAATRLLATRTPQPSGSNSSSSSDRGCVQGGLQRATGVVSRCWSCTLCSATPSASPCCSSRSPHRTASHGRWTKCGRAYRLSTAGAPTDGRSSRRRCARTPRRAPALGWGGACRAVACSIGHGARGGPSHSDVWLIGPPARLLVIMLVCLARLLCRVQEHPVLGIPFFCLHPCQTADVMSELLAHFRPKAFRPDGVRPEGAAHSSHAPPTAAAAAADAIASGAASTAEQPPPLLAAAAASAAPAALAPPPPVVPVPPVLPLPLAASLSALKAADGPTCAAASTATANSSTLAEVGRTCFDVGAGTSCVGPGGHDDDVYLLLWYCALAPVLRLRQPTAGFHRVAALLRRCGCGGGRGCGR